MLHQNKLLFNKVRIFKKKSSFAKRLHFCPQKKGFCKKIFILNPKKPNSALRKVSKCFLNLKKHITIHIPGIGHNLQKHSHVLIYGFRF